MRKAILAAVLLSAIAHFAGAQTVEVQTSPIDADFAALMKWAVALSNDGNEWNDRCGENRSADGCQVVRAIIDAEYKFFIECASRYTPVAGDTGCRADLRPVIIAHEVSLAKWNRECGGKALTEQCSASGKALADEATKIKEAMAKCSGENL